MSDPAAPKTLSAVFAEVEVAAAKVERLQKIGALLWGLFIAVVGAVLSVSSWWADAAKGGIVLISIQSQYVWVVFLLLSNAAMFTVMWLWGFTWHQRKDKLWKEAWTAELSLLPDVMPDIKVEKNGDVAFTIRVINRGPRRWFIKKIDWGKAAINIGGSVNKAEPVAEATVSNVIAPWAEWRQRFVVNVALKPEVQALNAVQVVVPLGAALWLESDKTAADYPVPLGGHIIYAPVLQ